MPFTLKPHGSQGYKYLLVGNDYALKVMDWQEPRGTRPSMVVELRSELLWRLGPKLAVDRLLDALRANGAELLEVKVSRADLCVDLLCDAGHWVKHLQRHMVTAADGCEIHQRHGVATGLSIGKAPIRARFYDKAREIAEKSGKTWFFDLWKLEAVPEGQMVLRAEFQCRRDALRELGVQDAASLFALLPHLWAYLTGKWLKFQGRPGKHHTQRRTLPWWERVQASFVGLQVGEPLIRAAAISAEVRRLDRLINGAGTSRLALELDRRAEAVPGDLGRQEVTRAVAMAGKEDAEFRAEVERKRARRSRLTARQEQATAQRQRLGMGEQP